MTGPRDEILARIRAAVQDVPAAEPPDDTDVPRDYRRTGSAAPPALVEQLVDRLADYRAQVRRVPESGLAAAIGAACAARGARRRGAPRLGAPSLVVPHDLPAAWLPEGIEIVPDDPLSGALSNEALDAAGGVLTGCALAIAATGTIVLDGGPGQGRRALTLLPDYHICVVRSDQIVESVPEAIAALRGAVPRPMTFISGPSATSDIELNRVEGVHGPRTLEVLIVT